MKVPTTSVGKWHGQVLPIKKQLRRWNCEAA